MKKFAEKIVSGLQLRHTHPVLVAITPTLLFVIALAIANAPFLWLSNSIFIQRAVLNVDLVVALCILPRAPVIGILLLVAGWSVDWIVVLSKIYNFSSIADFVDSMRYAGSLEYKGFIGWSSLPWVVPFIAAVGILLVITRKQENLWRPGLAITLFLVAADASNGTSMLSNRDTLRYGINIAGSPTASFTKSVFFSPTQLSQPLHKLRMEDTVQGLIDIPTWAATNPERGILFVIIESLGIPKDLEIREWVYAQWLDKSLQQRFEVRSAEIPFAGSTTAGELRSLCMLAGSYRNIDTVQGTGCLPARLLANGWSTIGMHGFYGQMFSRVNWWPSIGIQKTFFGDSEQLHQIRCGMAFRGTCDNKLLEAGFKALMPKRFVYLLTLNTHLPVEPVADNTPYPPMCDGLTANREVCNHLSATTAVLRQLRKEIDAANVEPLVVIVGDHAPPFSDKLSRDAFLPNKVPAVILVPR